MLTLVVMAGRQRPAERHLLPSVLGGALQKPQGCKALPKTLAYLRLVIQALLSAQLVAAEQAVREATRQGRGRAEERAFLQERAEDRVQLQEARLLLARERAQCERVTELMVGLEAGLEESKAREGAALARLARLEDEQAATLCIRGRHPVYSRSQPLS